MELKNSLGTQLDHAATLFIENGTIHGLNVYKFIKNRKLRNVTFYLAALILLFLPLVLAFATSKFFSDTTIKSSVEWKAEDYLDFPNVTICHPNYFSKRKMSDLNVSAPLANYILYGINTDLRDHIQTMLKIESYQELLKKLDLELQQKLLETGLNFPELVQAMALDLKDFLIYCEFPNQNAHRDSCSDFFDSDPIFTPRGGICWTSSWNFQTRSVVRPESIRIWTNIKREKSLDLDFHMHGANALERLSPILALTLNDFPIGQVSRAPINLPLKGFLRLKLTKATIDRTGLRGQTLSLHKDMCVESDELFEARFKVPYTEANCGSTLLASFLDDCSMSTLTGLPKDQDKRACEPWDFILLANKSFEPQRELIKTEKLTATPIIVQHINGQMCPKDCFFQTYNTVPSISEGNVKLMTDYFNKVASPKDISSPEDISGLELFFSTLESSTTTLYRDSLAVFLSQVGGWLGLCIGASVLSVVELTVFFGHLLRVFCKNITNCF
ncbi:uncharacterized protein LOC131880677 [Tigriopus californicus]|uniref:uncharacterized protein LOC131880677 n=1 Tax=Tigriopus californicus TaxID=6832 RepID=UPI0027DA7043|nr:uncharacterized protein LOC131880677 [Tigriopus californicus]